MFYASVLETRVRERESRKWQTGVCQALGYEPTPTILPTTENNRPSAAERCNPEKHTQDYTCINTHIPHSLHTLVMDSVYTNICPNIHRYCRLVAKCTRNTFIQTHKHTWLKINILWYTCACVNLNAHTSRPQAVKLGSSVWSWNALSSRKGK